MTHLLGALFMLACGLFGFALDSLDAPAVCVGLAAIVLIAAEIAYRWDGMK